MEHYIINQKKITIEKNKEFHFRIPIRLNLANSKIIVENASKLNKEDLIVSFNFKNIKSEDEGKLITISTEPFTISYSIMPNMENNGEFLLYGCTSNNNANIEVSILSV